MTQGAAAAIAVLAMLGAPAFARAEQGHGGHHGTVDGAVKPGAPGQDTFAAIAEIVAILDADPDTDWSRVNIGALHRHLLDMETLFTRTYATEQTVPGGLKMTIADGGAGDGAAARMVPAHAPFLGAQTGWTSIVDVEGGAVVWTVTAASEAEAIRIRALGFHGLMATGGHHRRHHLAIARGEAMR